MTDGCERSGTSRGVPGRSCRVGVDVSINAAGPVGDGEVFAPWVEWRHERGRRGRTLVTAVNHRDGEGFYADAAELDPNHPRHHAVIAELHDGGFLPGSSPRVEVADSRSHIGSGLVWRGADRFVRTVHARLGRRLFTPGWVVAQIALAAVGAVALVRTVGSRPVHLHAEPAHVPFIIVLGLVAVFIHEFGHALVTVHYGRHVRVAGLRLHLGAPAFYVESLDALLLTRRQRLIQAAAGP